MRISLPTLFIVSFDDFLVYNITACIPHVKNHTNDTLKPHRSGVPRSTDTEKRLAFSPTDKWNKFAFCWIMV